MFPKYAIGARSSLFAKTVNFAYNQNPVHQLHEGQVLARSASEIAIDQVIPPGERIELLTEAKGCVLTSLALYIMLTLA